jgi:hypothetical protein
MNHDLQLVLASAVVSAIVSGLLTMYSQHLERKHKQLESELARKERQDELLLAKAVELALDQKKTLIGLRETANITPLLLPDILNVAQLYRYLHHLLDHKCLPNDLKTKLRDQCEKLRKPDNAAFIDELLNRDDLACDELAAVGNLEEGLTAQ